MAIMVCPECGKQVSDCAETCPHCGYPISKYIAEQKKQEEFAKKEEQKRKSIEAKKEAKKAKSKKKPLSVKKIVIISAVTVVIVAGVVTGFIYGIKKPYDAAWESYTTTFSEYGSVAEGYNVVKASIETKNTELDKAIEALNTLIYADIDPYDMKVEEAAVNLIANAKGKKIDCPQSPEFRDTAAITSYSVFQTKDILEEVSALSDEIKDIQAAMGSLVVPDYTAIIADIGNMQKNMEKSILQHQQVTNPSEAFVIGHLQELSGITEIEAATEDNDPNGNLHKTGGYTSAVFFIYDQVTDPYVLNSSGNTPVERGTDGGGCIEVYATEEDAEERNTYLGAFDGSAFTSGSHTVCGTVVVRTSSELTATQQKELEAAIISSFIELK